MENGESGQPYDLEERTFHFAKRVRAFIKVLPQSLCNREDARQLVRSSGSVGANYIEANDALTSKDRVMRIKISRKEAKETIYWLRLLDADPHVEESNFLIREAHELMSILGSILRKPKSPVIERTLFTPFQPFKYLVLIVLNFVLRIFRLFPS